MKALLLFLLFSGILTPLYAGTETLTTYYPAPDGNYNKIVTTSLKLVATTLKEVENQYKCSYNPAEGLSPCPAGLVFYNTDAHIPFISDGTHWRALPASCVPNSPGSCNANQRDDCGNPC
jgi:hypothetical protein